jgi:hypothetical protein
MSAPVLPVPVPDDVLPVGGLAWDELPALCPGVEALRAYVLGPGVEAC